MVRFIKKNRKRSPPAIKVKVERGDANLSAFTFSTSFQIGRDNTCQVRLDNGIVSRYHAEIYYYQENWWIKDLGSSNGTLVEGEKIDHLRLVKPTKVELGRDGPILLLSVGGMSQKATTVLKETRRFEKITLAKSLGEIQRRLKPERVILICILALMAIVGQAIIIYSVVKEQDLSALFGVSIDSFAIWPINRLWQITKDLMAISMASSMLRNAKSQPEKHDAVELGNQVVLSILGKNKQI